MKLFEKAKKFYNEHRYEIKTVVTCVTIIGVGWYASKKVSDYIYGGKDDTSDIALPPVVEPEVNERYEWSDEKYRETYDRVVEFAKTLPLIDGESYWIDKNDEWNNGEPIVSHMIDYVGVYPNEEEGSDEDAVQ